MRKRIDSRGFDSNYKEISKTYKQQRNYCVKVIIRKNNRLVEKSLILSTLFIK